MKKKLRTMFVVSALAFALVINLQSAFDHSGFALIAQETSEDTGGETGGDTGFGGCSATQFDNMILDQVTCFDSENTWGEKMDCINQNAKCCESTSQTTCS